MTEKNKRKDISIEEQAEFFDRHIAEVDLTEIFLDVQEDAKVLARERMIKYYPKYGDENFHKTLAQLRQEQMEEIADAINYQVFKKYVKENGEG